jgi:hypothetical protein
MSDVSVRHAGQLHQFVLELVRKPFLVGAQFFLNGQQGPAPLVSTVCTAESPYFERLSSLSNQALSDLCVSCLSSPANFERALAGIPGKLSIILPLRCGGDA